MAHVQVSDSETLCCEGVVLLDTQINNLCEKMSSILEHFFSDSSLIWTKEKPYHAMSFWQRKRNEFSTWRLAIKGRNASILEVKCRTQDYFDGNIHLLVDNHSYVFMVNKGLHRLAEELGFKIIPKIAQFQ